MVNGDSRQQLLEALNVRVCSLPDLDEQAVWVESHRILIVHPDLTRDQILGAVGRLLLGRQAA